MTKTAQAASIKIKDNHFHGQVYLVTGASGGLGSAISLALAKQGATVVLTGRNEKKLDTLYDQIEAAGYPTPAIIPFDLEQTDEDIYNQLINSIYNEFKKLDGIVHAACYLGIIGPIGSQTSSDWQKCLQVNVNASALLTKTCLPLLQQAKQPTITFISDSSARKGNAYWGAYGVSKIALESFSTMLADELESSIVNCNIFTPGPCILPIRKKTHPGEENATLPSAEAIAEKLLITTH